MSATGTPLANGDSLTLTLEPDAENAAVARQAIAELADRRGVETAVRTSAEVVVTEAFTNATCHAYPGGSRSPIEVTASTRGGSFEIIVRDRGDGFRPRPVSPDGGGRMGLLLIAALADSVRLLHLREGGIEVRAAVTPASATRGLVGPAD
jgi:anti-sigma regulatory factor (Ser/Thr protein kinase)